MDISKKDLRIGNYLRDKLTGELLLVSDLTENNIGAFVVNRDKFPLPNGWQIEPIPLTEEWLLKFGFERMVFTQRIEYVLIIDIDNQKHFIEFAFPRNEKIEVIMYYDKSFYKNIKYVHQLQNLYFALTGEELTTKK